MIYCEFCEMSKNIFFYRTPPVAASANNQLDTLLNSYFEEHLFLRDTFLISLILCWTAILKNIYFCGTLSSMDASVHSLNSND